jgi:NAD(P)-dependent dehydrogenase (short-subunit alcohol dehydrogenase family)
MNSRIAVVTGANRGIGLEVVRQLVTQGDTVVLGSRDLAKGKAAAGELGLPVHVEQLDVTDQDSVARLGRTVAERFGRLDILVNNAAIHYDTWQTATDADLGVVQQALDTNVFGAWRLTQAVLPSLRRSEHGRIVNVSSGAGAITGMGGWAPAYKVSKVSLNALTLMWADELAGDGILVNSVCPGWVATDMGGAGGRPVAEGAAGVVWAAHLPDDGPTGGFFRDREPIDW